MSDLVGNPEDRFSQNEAHFIKGNTSLSFVSIDSMSNIFGIAVCNVISAL